MRKNSIKNIRINEEVRKQLQEIIMRQLKDPRIHPMTTVTKAEVAPDLKTCRAYISVLGSAQALEQTISGLQAAEGFIRHELAVSVNLRNTPQLTFIGDDSIAYGVDMAHKIDKVIAADDKSRLARGESLEDAQQSPKEEDIL